MKRFDLLRVPKEIEIIGMDVSELGAMSEDMYAKLRKDFGFLTPSASPNYSTYLRYKSSLRAPGRESVNRGYNEDSEADGEDIVVQKLVFKQAGLSP